MVDWSDQHCSPHVITNIIGQNGVTLKAVGVKLSSLRVDKNGIKSWIKLNSIKSVTSNHIASNSTQVTVYKFKGFQL